MRTKNQLLALLGALTLLLPAALLATATTAQAATACTSSADTRALQQRLRHLHFATGPIDGCDGPRTTSALLAFQKAKGLDVDGDAGPLTRAALKRGGRPVAIRDKSKGTHVEIDIEHQLLTLVKDGKPFRIYNATTGAPGHETPQGSFTVQRKYVRDWSVPYRTWMPYASYFTDDGVAIHSGVVGTAPASHGCVRLRQLRARRLPRDAGRHARARHRLDDDHAPGPPARAHPRASGLSRAPAPPPSARSPRRRRSAAW